MVNDRHMKVRQRKKRQRRFVRSIRQTRKRSLGWHDLLWIVAREDGR